MQRHGFKRIQRAIKGARSLEEGVEFLRSLTLSYILDVHTIDELTAYSYKVDPLTGLVLPILEDKDNHVIDSLRYACEGARRTMKVVRPGQCLRNSTTWQSERPLCSCLRWHVRRGLG